MTRPASADDFAAWNDAGIVELNDGNYERLMRGKLVVAVVFAHWCGHCRNMAHDYAVFAQHVKDLNALQKSDYMVASIDATDPGTTLLRTMLRVTGFPTIKSFDRTRKSYDYEGARTAQGLAESFAAFVEEHK